MPRKTEKTVETGYPVEFIKDAFAEGADQLAALLAKLAGEQPYKLLLVADQNVVSRTDGLGLKIGKFIQGQGIRLASRAIVLGGGEKIKADGLQSAMRVARGMLDAKLGKDDIVLVLGGGTLLDVVGWAAAQVRGGVKVLRMPTTVASMVDGAFANCAALDSENVKDAFRLRSVPAAVVIDSTFNATVLDGVWRGGVAEAIRIALAGDAPLLRKIARNAEALRNRDAALLEEIVAAAAKTRQKKGECALALWSASRLEAMSGYKMPHGYAVAMGLRLEIAYALRRSLLKEEDHDLVCKALQDCGALDAISHSAHLLSQADSLMFGLDAWRLATGSAAIQVPNGLGKTMMEEAPDAGVYREILKGLSDSIAGASKQG